MTLSLKRSPYTLLEFRAIESAALYASKYVEAATVGTSAVATPLDVAAYLVLIHLAREQLDGCPETEPEALANELASRMIALSKGTPTE